MFIILGLIESDNLLYFCDGYEETATLQIIICSDNSFNYLIKLPNETIIVTTRECLRPTRKKDNITLPSTLDDYKDIIKYLTVKDIENIMQPNALSRLEEEYLDTHNRLQHMSSSEIFVLCDLNHLPKIFFRLKFKRPPCMSYILGKLQRRAWHNTENNKKSIRKPFYSKPCKYISNDEIISGQIGLVSRLSSLHTRERITSAT